MTRPRGNRNCGAKIAARQAKVAAKLDDQLSQQDLADSLGVSKPTVLRDRKFLKALYVEESKDVIVQHVENQLTRITAKWNEIETDLTMTSAEKHLAWSRWMKLEMDLLGTAAPAKSITAHVKTDGTGRFHMFVQSAAGLTDAQMEQVFQFAASLERLPLTMPTGPPPLVLESGQESEEEQ